MVNLVGTYHVKADAKGRITLPSALKAQLEPMLEQGFVLKHGTFWGYLELHPRDEYNAMMMQIKKKGRFDRKYQRTLRKFVSGAQPVSIDQSGRLQISKDLVEFAGIQKEVVLTAAIDMIEIWDKERYDNDMDEGRDEHLDTLEEVFNDDNEPVS